MTILKNKITVCTLIYIVSVEALSVVSRDALVSHLVPCSLFHVPYSMFLAPRSSLLEPSAWCLVPVGICYSRVDRSMDPSVVSSALITSIC